MKITVPELALIGGTRGLLGIGIGLLASTRLSDDQRRAVGGALVAIGALSTIPLFFQLFRRNDDDARGVMEMNRSDTEMVF